jgi:hypothetical protein
VKREIKWRILKDCSRKRLSSLFPSLCFTHFGRYCTRWMYWESETCRNLRVQQLNNFWWESEDRRIIFCESDRTFGFFLLLLFWFQVSWRNLRKVEGIPTTMKKWLKKVTPGDKGLTRPPDSTLVSTHKNEVRSITRRYFRRQFRVTTYKFRKWRMCSWSSTHTPRTQTNYPTYPLGTMWKLGDWSMTRPSICDLRRAGLSICNHRDTH